MNLFNTQYFSYIYVYSLYIAQLSGCVVELSAEFLSRYLIAYLLYRFIDNKQY